MNNIRLLQDHEVENYGSTKNINELLDEVRNVVDIYFNQPIDSNNNNSRSSPRTVNTQFRTSPSPSSTSPNGQLYKQPSFGQQSPLKVSSRFQLNPTSSSSPSPNSTPPSSSSPSQNRKYGATTTNTSNNSPNSHQYSLQNQKKQNESSFIDVRTIGLKELTTLLNRRREGSIHIRAIKQIGTLYQHAKQSQSVKNKFIEEILQSSCLRSLLSFLTLYEPPGGSESSEFIAQLESVSLLALLTENDNIKQYIKQTGDIATIVGVLTWAYRSVRAVDLLFPLVNLISNLATHESCAYVLKRSGAIPPIFELSINVNLENHLRILSINTLIIFASYSDPKISETIIENPSSLKVLIQQITDHSDIRPNDITTESISIKLLDLLYQVSDCPKTRAFACESGIEKLVELLSVNEIYPSSLNRGNYYYCTSNTPREDPVANQATLQIKVLQCLEKLSNNENNRSKIGMVGIYNSMSYLKPMYNIKPDIFRWNTNILERVLKFIFQLLFNDHVKQVFVEKNGCNIIVAMVSSEYLPSTVLLSCAQVLGQIVTPKKTENSRIFYSVDKVMGNEIVPSLMKLFKSYPHERSLQLLVCKVFTNLGTRDENKQTIFSEGGIQLLHNLLLSDDMDVIASSCETIAVLSTNKFIRKVLRLLNSVEILIHHLNGSNQSIKKSSIHVLYNISCDEEGLDLLLDEKTGISPQTLISLLFSNDSQIQIYTMKILSNLTSDEQYLTKFILKGGIPAVLNSLYSNNENLQYSVLEFLNKIIQNSRTVQSSILNDGIVDKLKKLSTHENVTRSSSILVQPLRTLLMTVKNMQPPESPPIEYRGQTSPNVPRSSRVGNSQQPAQRSPPQSRYNSSSPPTHSSSGEVKQPDYKKIEAVLGKLDVDQLRSVILEMVRHDPAISEILPSSIKGVLSGQRGQINSPPQPSATSYSSGNHHSTSHTSSPPPPHPTSRTTLKSPTSQPKNPFSSNSNHHNSSNNNKRNSNGKAPVYDSLMDEIRDKVGNGKINLKHIDTEKETENRRKDELMQKNNCILKDIVNNAQKRQVEVFNKKVLVDSGTISGMRIWKKDFDLWKQELQAMFRRNMNLIILIFRLLESIDMDFPFKEAMEISNYQSEEQLSQALIRVGFNIKQSTYSQDNVVKVDYISISKPTGLPFKLLLATILEYMK